MSVLRPVTFRTRVINLLLALSAPTARVLRVIAPIAHPPFMKMFLVTRYDDVREVFLNDRVYGVLYKSNLDVILDRQPFILGMDDTPEYRAQIAALRAVVEASDPAALAAKSTVVAERLLRAANGRLEFVDFVRQITFEVLCPYFGITRVAQDVLEEWATRLFEYQFTYTGKNIPLLHDTALQAEGREMAESLAIQQRSRVTCSRRCGSIRSRPPCSDGAVATPY
jgi:cytochrome P450